jgi:hypothetical protein
LGAVLGRRGLDAQALTPWNFPSAGACRDKLGPTPLPAGFGAWVDTFVEDVFAALRRRTAPLRGARWSLAAGFAVDEIAIAGRCHRSPSLPLLLQQISSKKSGRSSL